MLTAAASPSLTDVLGLQGSGTDPGNEMREPAASDDAPAGGVDELLVPPRAGAGSSREITSGSEKDGLLVPGCAGAGSSRGITACSMAFGLARRTGAGTVVARSGFTAARSEVSGLAAARGGVSGFGCMAAGSAVSVATTGMARTVPGFNLKGGFS